MPRRIEDVAWKVQRFTRELLKRYDGEKRDATSFEKIDQSFERSGIVPVSRVMVASQLMVARWLFKTFPEVMRVHIVKWVGNVVSKKATKQFAKAIVGKAGGSSLFGTAASASLESMVQEFEAEKIEREIRGMCAEVRREFNEMVLPRNRGKRKTRSVRTRHGEPGHAGRPAKARRKLESVNHAAPTFEGSGVDMSEKLSHEEGGKEQR